MELKKIIRTDFGNKQGKKENESLAAAKTFLEKNPDYIYCYTDDTFYQYVKGSYYKRWDKENTQMIKAITECEDIDGVNNMSRPKKLDILRNIKDLQHHSFEEFNQDNLINFQNCYFNLQTREVIPHSMDYLSTIQLPYEYDKDAVPKIWLRAIVEIFQGSSEKIDLLQEFCGYCLTKDTKQEKALFMLGNGQNGKSTILEGINYMLGEANVSHLNLRNLVKPEYVGLIMDKFVNIVSEIPKAANEYEDAFKMLASGEPVTVNTKFIPTYDARPYCKLIFAANRMPRIGDTSQGVYRRLIVINFNREFEEHEQDKNLKVTIKSEAAGIFNWALEGLDRLNERGYFDIGKTIRDDIKEVEIDNNVVMQFVNEYIETTGNPDDHIFKDEAFDKYRAFCLEVDSKSKFSRRNFGAEINRIFRKIVDKEFKVNVVEGTKRTTKRAWNRLKWRVEGEQEGEQIKWES